jgi:glycosyltransferase involved in cell wall biosynthesis
VSTPARVLFVSGSAASATLRYRVRLSEEALRTGGVRTSAVHVTDRRAADLAARADVVVLYRCPAGAEVVALLHRLRRRPDPPLVTYDVDDLVFRREHLQHLPFLRSFTQAQRTTFVRDVLLRERLIPYADVVTGSTQPILDELATLTDAPARLLPNGVGTQPLRLADAASTDPVPAGPFRVGYFSGSATHDEDWAAVEGAVVDALLARPPAELWLVGRVTPTDAVARLGERVRVLPPVDWTELPTLLRQVDVTLAPLARSPFTEAKSAIKWLESALVGTPTIATPTEPFRVDIADGVNGFLADHPSEWTGTLVGLADDRDRCRSVGAAARSAALAGYAPAAQGARLVAALSSVPGASRSAQAGGPDRPPLPRLWRVVPVQLESYPFPDELAGMDIGLPASSRLHAAPLVAGMRARALGRVAARSAKRAARRVVTRLAATRSAGGTSS